ncbi:MAG: hypothetical protein KGR16_04105 [Verrucomicrobia bacterium]|nr:hypothetical protein [Verrucomicrobiota bacterium]MDE3046797.1 hypothetical protein [Verrucomicrobiota bacterium]
MMAISGVSNFFSNCNVSNVKCALRIAVIMSVALVVFSIGQKSATSHEITTIEPAPIRKFTQIPTSRSSPAPLVSETASLEETFLEDALHTYQQTRAQIPEDRELQCQFDRLIVGFYYDHLSLFLRYDTYYAQFMGLLFNPDGPRFYRCHSG